MKLHWTRSVTKSTGKTRKQFAQWAVPVDLKRKCTIEDGTEYIISARLGSYVLDRDAYVLSSGGEFRIPKEMADGLKAECIDHAKGAIHFELASVNQEPQHAALEAAHRKADAEQAYDPLDEKDARNRVKTFIAQRRGQPEFRRKLLVAYRNRCAISCCDCSDALEAAHIRPYKGPDTNHIKNGILLRSDIHTLFDLGKMHIRADDTVSVCKDLLATVYKEFHNKKIQLPDEEADWPMIKSDMN